MSVTDQLIQAISLQNQGQLEAAGRLFRQVLAFDPGNAHAFYSLGLMALNAGQIAQAADLCAGGVAAAPGFAPLHYLQGAVLQAAGDREGALRSFDAALAIQPDYIEVLLNSGALLRSMFRHQEALERFNRILAIDPNHANALGNCGILLTEFKQSEQAIAMFERLLKVNPRYDFAPGLLFYERMHICDWTDFDAMTQRLVAGVRAGERTCKSLAFMSASDQAGDHLAAATVFADRYCPPRDEALWRGESYRHDRIRLAYVSPDFREHPVGHLMAGIFEHHDKSRFETIAISLGLDDQSRLRQRMVRAFDSFIDARDMGSEQIARRMRAMEIDIAVDLGGFTSDTRTDIFAWRPAPLQINFLGYPGTLGTSYFDYILADRHTIPPEHQAFYREKVAYLPDTYLPTDGSVRIAERTPSRAECGLPEKGFVFCAFSHDFKISPPVFGAWMRLLAQVPGSVLWLASRGDAARRNLRLEAAARGVDPSRLVFAERLPRVEDHLARYRQADLFLDTHPYNAHTTAADALMAGLPVLTMVGNAFPARVAGSLLHAAGLPELATQSLPEYEALALQLAREPERLQALRARLAANRSTHALFDTARFCRNLEACLASLPAATLQPTPADDAPILIDGVFFQTYNTGIARVWRSLLRAWAGTAFGRRLIVLDRVRTAPRVEGLRYLDIPAHAYADLEADRRMLQDVCDAHHAALFMSTYYTMPITTPSVMMVHDMIPEVLGADTGNIPMWREKHDAVRRAHSFVAVSGNTARDLRRFFPAIAEHRITVAHNGVDLRPASPEQVAQFRASHGITKPYFLLVGGRTSYKNATLFFHAFEKFAQRREDFDILCTGPREQLEPEFARCVGDARVHLRDLSDAELAAAYSGAVALVYPSLYEGFGMPVIEAFACRCPVIACPNSAIPEVAGDAALFVGGADIDAMVLALLQVQESATRAALIARGEAQASKFSWHEMAARIQAVAEAAATATRHTLSKAAEPGSQPASVSDQAEQALQWHRAGDPAKATAVARALLQTQPRHPVALHLLGLIAYEAGRFAQAVEQITASLDAEPNQPEAYVNLGCAAAAAGDRAAAIRHFTQALRLRPDQPDAKRNLDILQSATPPRPEGERIAP